MAVVTNEQIFRRLIAGAFSAGDISIIDEHEGPNECS